MNTTKPIFANCPFCAGTGRGRTVRRGRVNQCWTCSGTGKVLLRRELVEVDPDEEGPRAGSDTDANLFTDPGAT